MKVLSSILLGTAALVYFAPAVYGAPSGDLFASERAQAFGVHELKLAEKRLSDKLYNQKVKLGSLKMDRGTILDSLDALRADLEKTSAELRDVINKRTAVNHKINEKMIKLNGAEAAGNKKAAKSAENAIKRLQEKVESLDARYNELSGAVAAKSGSVSGLEANAKLVAEEIAATEKDIAKTGFQLDRVQKKLRKLQRGAN